jgi:hypothetical protein
METIVLFMVAGQERAALPPKIEENKFDLIPIGRTYCRNKQAAARRG